MSWHLIGNLRGPAGAPGEAIIGPPGLAGRDGADIDLELIARLVDDAVVKAVARLPPAKDGAPGPKGDIGPPGPQGISGERGDIGFPGLRGEPGEKGDSGVDGKDADPELIRRLVDDAVGKLPKPKDGVPGRQGDQGEMGPMGPQGIPGQHGDRGERGETGERGEQGAPGKLPIVKAFVPDRVFYEGDVVAADGATYQCLHDTARHVTNTEHWICIARAGADGAGLNFRGTFDVREVYRKNDVTASDGASFVARHDNPGVLPGDGWQLLARQGRTGRPGPPGESGLKGEKGDRGERGADAPVIVNWTLDRKNFRAIATLNTGKEGAVLDLRPLFEEYQNQTAE